MIRRPGTTAEAVLDRMIEGGLIALLVFTPLAFGAVTTWALSLMEAGLIVLSALWLGRVVWSRPRQRARPGAGEPDPFWRPLGYRFIRTGLGLPALALLLLVALQLVPMPRAAIRALSPAAETLYARTLPGWSDGRPIDYSRLQDLVGVGGADAIVPILQAPGDLPIPSSIESVAPRTLSIYPYATAGRLILAASLMMAFVLSLHTLRTPAMIERLAWVVTLLGLGMSVLAVVQKLQWNGKIYWFYPVAADASPYGPFQNYNHFAAWLEMAAPLALGLFVARLTRVAGRFQADPPARPLSGLSGLLRLGPDTMARLGMSAFASVLMLATLLLSGSRGGILSLAVAMTLYGGALAWSGRTRRAEWAIGVLAIGAAILFAVWAGAPQLQEAARRLSMVASFEAEPSLAARLVGWQYTLRIVADFPLLGSGLGTFPEAWLGYYPPGTANIWQEAHNDYLQLAAETGVTGLLIALWALGVFVARHLRGAASRTGAAGDPDDYLLHGIAVGLLALIFHSLVDFSLQVPAIALLFVVLSAVLAGAGARRREVSA